VNLESTIRPDIHPSPIVLILSNKADNHFIIPQRIEGCQPRHCSQCPKLHIAVVFIQEKNTLLPAAQLDRGHLVPQFTHAKTCSTSATCIHFTRVSQWRNSAERHEQIQRAKSWVTTSLVLAQHAMHTPSETERSHCDSFLTKTKTKKHFTMFLNLLSNTIQGLFRPESKTNSTTLIHNLYTYYDEKPNTVAIWCLRNFWVFKIQGHFKASPEFMDSMGTPDFNRT